MITSKIYPIDTDSWNCINDGTIQFKRIELIPGKKTVYGFTNDKAEYITSLAWAQMSTIDTFSACAFGFVQTTGLKSLDAAEKECLRLLLFSLSGITGALLKEQNEEMFKAFRATNQKP